MLKTSSLPHATEQYILSGLSSNQANRLPINGPRTPVPRETIRGASLSPRLPSQPASTNPPSTTTPNPNNN